MSKLTGGDVDDVHPGSELFCIPVMAGRTALSQTPRERKRLLVVNVFP